MAVLLEGKFTSLFKNRVLKPSNFQLFKCYPENNKWILKNISKKKINDYFYILKNSDISNNEIYFLPPICSTHIKK